MFVQNPRAGDQNNGYPKRFEKLKKINKNYNPDNFFLAETRMGNFNIDKKFNANNYNILIIGDSFAEDLYNALEKYKENDEVKNRDDNESLKKYLLNSMYC